MARFAGRKLYVLIAIGIAAVVGVALGLHIYGSGGAGDGPAVSAAKPAGTRRRVAEDKNAEPAVSVLRSALAGSWYPEDPETLRKQIAGFFEKAQAEPIENVVGLILPHAGYSYSGPTAAAAVKTIAVKYDRIVVIGPSHRTPLEEVLSVPRVTHYETPLGRVPLDVEFIEKLLKYPVFQNVPQTHKYEHSVQIELPLLQYKQKDFKLVPIVAGTCSFETVRKAADILKGLIDAKTLVVASSDFTHYGAGYGYVPFTRDIPEQIKKLDMGAYELIEALDAKGFYDYRFRTGATICGFIPISILLSMVGRQDVQAHLVGYTTSGQKEGDYSRSVSYLSVAFSGTWTDAPAVEPPAGISQLSEQDKEQLLALARKTIAYALDHRKIPDVSQLGIEVAEHLKVPRAAFVTLKKGGELRGCIGDIFPRQPLYRSVLSNAINAAFADRRFKPLAKDELEQMTIEISALTPPQAVDSYQEIRIGTDGAVLNKSGHSAVFLPQVAPEQGWTTEQMLTQLSLKAGLGPDDWKSGASFLVFQAEVFGEERK